MNTQIAADLATTLQHEKALNPCTKLPLGPKVSVDYYFLFRIVQDMTSRVFVFVAGGVESVFIRRTFSGQKVR